MAFEISWNQLRAQAWEEALLCAPNTPYQQHWAYGAILAQAKSGSVQRAAIYRDDVLMGVAQMQVRRFLRCFHLGLVMRGPVWLSDDAAAALSESDKHTIMQALLREAPLPRFSRKIVMPESVSTLAKPFTRLVSGYSTVMLDLCQSEAALLAAMDGKWRNRLRAAQKAGFIVNTPALAEESYGWLLQCEAEQSKRIGYSALSPALVPLWQMQMGEKGLCLVQARFPDAADEAKPCAAMLFLVHGKTATYHIGWADEQAKKHNAHNLLLWEAMQQLQSRGIETLDLGGVNTQDGAGIARFKLGTGGELLQLSGTYAL